MKPARRIDKPWGCEIVWADTPHYLGTILKIKRGERLSLQLHRWKAESILLYSGRMTLVFEDEHGTRRDILLLAGQAYDIPTGRRHRMIALDDCEVIEVSTPHFDDVVRLEDSYGRAEPGAATRREPTAKFSLTQPL